MCKPSIDSDLGNHSHHVQVSEAIPSKDEVSALLYVQGRWTADYNS